MQGSCKERQGWRFAMLLVLSLSVLSNIVFAQQPQCGDVITSSVTLEGDLFCLDSGLLITGDNIVLDCAGHGITYSMLDSGDGITVVGNNVTVTGCTVSQGSLSNISYGVVIVRSSDSLISSNTITTFGVNSIGVYVENTSSNIRLSGNSISTESSFSDAISVDGSAGSAITENILSVTGSSSNAILASGQNSILSGNSITLDGSAGIGIALQNAQSSLLSNNTVVLKAAQARGIALDSSPLSAVNENNIFGETDSIVGISVLNSAGASIALNNITAKGAYSSLLAVVDSNLSTIQLNQFSAEGPNSSAIRISSSLNALARGNGISLSGSDSAAVIADSSSHGSNISENFLTLTGATSKGISLDSSSGCDLSNNSITTTGDRSISVWVSNAAGCTLLGNDLTSALYSMALFNSTNISVALNIMQNALLSGGEYALTGNSLLGASPKVSVSDSAAVSLSGNYWGRVQSPYFVKGVDVTDSAFSDDSPLKAPFGEAQLSAPLTLDDFVYPILGLLILSAFIFLMFKQMRTESEEKEMNRQRKRRNNDVI